jgi:hypothetical protein
MRSLLTLLLLLCTVAWSTPARADALDPELAQRRARTIRTAAFASGAVVGAGLGVSIVMGPDLFHPNADPRAVRWVQVTGAGVQIASSTWATWWFADVQLRHPRGPWRSLGWGTLYAMAAGAMSFGTGFGTILTMGWLTDTIRVGESVDAWYKIIPMNYGVGSLGGALTCIPVGLLLGPAISLRMRF